MTPALQISSGLDTQTILLLSQVIISAFTILVSIYVAIKYGEKAAVELESERELRRDHSRRYINEATRLLEGFPTPQSTVQCSVIDGKLKVREATIDKLPYETKMLGEHVKTGYVTLDSSLTKYGESCKRIADGFLDIYKALVPKLKDAVSQIPGKFWISPEHAVASFSNEVYHVLVNNGREEWFTVESSTGIIMTANAYVFAPEVISIENPAWSALTKAVAEDVKKLRDLWTSVPSIMENRSEIEARFHEIRILADDGVPLDGSCEAGRKAGFEGKDSESARTGRGERVAQWLGIFFGDLVWAIWKRIWILPNGTADAVFYIILVLIASMIAAMAVLFRAFELFPRLERANPFSSIFVKFVFNVVFVIGALDIAWALGHGMAPL